MGLNYWTAKKKKKLLFNCLQEHLHIYEKPVSFFFLFFFGGVGGGGCFWVCKFMCKETH